MSQARFIGELTIGAGQITNTHVSDSANISATKTEHRYKAGTNFATAIGGTPASRIEIVFVADVACTIKKFDATLEETGSSTDIDFDLKVNDSSVLSSAVNFTNADSDRTIKSGTINTAALSVGDIVSLDMTVTSATGATGAFAWVTIDELPAT